MEFSSGAFKFECRLFKKYSYFDNEKKKLLNKTAF
jgi:hypothetical protein